MTIVMLPDAQADLLDLQDCMLDRWTAGPLDRWTAGPLDRWTAGPLDRWTAGRMICGLPLKRTSLPSWRVWTRA